MKRPGSAILASIVVALALAALVGVNLVDEDLSPEARALFERAPRPFARDSGWALLAGFDAPAGEDPRAHAIASTPKTRDAAIRKAMRPSRGDALAVRAPAELLCLPQSQDCVRAFATLPQSVDDAVADNPILLARYDELLRSTGLADVIHGVDAYEMFFPASVVLGIQRVRLSQAGAAAARGRVDQALAWLEADAAFHRRWLGEADTLLTKMLALRTFTRSVAVGAQVARAAPSLTSAQAEALERIVAPLGTRERGLAIPVRAEAVLFSEMIDQMVAAPAAVSQVTGAPRLMAELAGATLRRNATLNFASPLYTAWMRLDQVETPALAQAIERIRASERAHLEHNWRWAYNHAGRAITAEGHYDASQYALRLRDADAFTALMRCAIRLRTRSIPQASASEFITGDSGCRDPWLARPFAWDGAKGEISFKPADAPGVERFGGVNGRVTFAPYR